MHCSRFLVVELYSLHSYTNKILFFNKFHNNYAKFNLLFKNELSSLQKLFDSFASIINQKLGRWHRFIL